MIEEFQISLVRMMENAGSCLAELARRMLGGDLSDRSVVVLAGVGGNGGGGLVAARHLANALADVEVCLSASPGDLSPVPREQLRILERMTVPITTGKPRVPRPDLVIDALLGYSQAGDPRGAAAQLISWTTGRPVVALDTPSGLELSTGTVHRPTVRARATMTLALPKEGLRVEGASTVVGDLYLADISVPPLVYERLGLDYSSPFAGGRVVRVAQNKAESG